MKASEIREAFLHYFEQKGHARVASASLVPAGDPTLLFTNAGMVQFKDVFLGNDKRAYTRATTAQRCVRASGKHNDLENVGYTARHHTFFEMLGNFSFGDYFKREAIGFAWELLTKIFHLPAEKLWVTVFEDDDEAADIWLKEIGVDPTRFSRCGEKDNFWAMGDTGPCGPCSEIFYDHGPEIAGGPPGSADADGDRYIEIWNLVFMQFNRDASGKLTPLPKPSVDTGMGLERLAAVLQGVHNNYDIDLFLHLIAAIREIIQQPEADVNALRVMADHIRSAAFLMADGVIPSNEGRGYVLRRIIRRALRHGYQIGIKEPFFYRIVSPLVREMGSAYPELVSAQRQIETTLHREETQFARTLENGMQLLETAMSELLQSGGHVLSGEVAFKLYDTYGFPVDLTADILREKNLTIDEAGFDAAMARQKDTSRGASQFAANYQEQVALNVQDTFIGYETLKSETKILALIAEGEIVDQLDENQSGVVILETTPFYGASGGQVGDVGHIRSGDAEFVVTNTEVVKGVRWQEGYVKCGTVCVNAVAHASVETETRQATARHHSATHLLHAALRRVLGEHVAQRGSLVDAEHLRFDFSHTESLTAAQCQAVEDLVNEQILQNVPVCTEIMTPDAAKASGAMALFGEKYGESVRVLTMGDFSKELCGGTHVRSTGEIGVFRIQQEMAIACGIRRIEAVAGRAALVCWRQAESTLLAAAALLKSAPDQIGDKITQLLSDKRALEKEILRLQSKQATDQTKDLWAAAERCGTVSVVVAKVDNVDVPTLRQMVDDLKARSSETAVLLVSGQGEKVSLIAGVTTALSERFSAKDWVNVAAEKVGGKGGGRADMAQAGGKDSGKIDAAVVAARTYAQDQLSR